MPRLLQSDLTADILRAEIQQFRNATFDRFADEGTNLHVQPAPSARPIFDHLGNFIGFDKYIFDVWAKHGKVMNVRATTTHSVLIRFQRAWVRVETILQHMEPQPNPLLQDRTASWELQWDWWKENGKRFRLLNLPPEIRDHIYSHVFGSEVQPYLTSSARRSGSRSWPQLLQHPGTALLRLNKQIGREAKHVLFLYSPFVVQHLGVLAPLIAHPVQQSNLRRLNLSFTHRDFLKLFGFQSTEEIVYHPSAAALALRLLKLDRLIMQFAAPARLTETSRLDGGCQTTIVNWILEAAQPWVCGHPVYVTGYVKAWQKKMFESITAKSVKAFDAWNKQRIALGMNESELADYDSWLEDIEEDEQGGVDISNRETGLPQETWPTSAVWEMPPICRCKTFCSVETWAAED